MQSTHGYNLDRKEGEDRIEARLVQNNHEIVLQGRGEGAISAFVDGWVRHSGQQVNVVDYSEHALGEGTGAEASAMCSSMSMVCASAVPPSTTTR